MIAHAQKNKEKNDNITRVWRNFPTAQADTQLRQARYC